MSYPVPVSTTSDYKAITTGASVTFDAVMAAPEFWVFSATTDMYICQGAAPTASAGDGSILVAAGTSIMLDASLGAKLAAIAATANGAGTLTKVKLVK